MHTDTHIHYIYLTQWYDSTKHKRKICRIDCENCVLVRAKEQDSHVGVFCDGNSFCDAAGVWCWRRFVLSQGADATWLIGVARWARIANVAAFTGRDCPATCLCNHQHTVAFDQLILAVVLRCTEPAHKPLMTLIESSEHSAEQELVWTHKSCVLLK
eukprot:COSAG01_NODE_269_length_19814_cov_109.983720_12_plen_157_part_00